MDQDPFLMWAMMLVAVAREDKRKADEAHEKARQKFKGRK